MPPCNKGKCKQFSHGFVKHPENLQRPKKYKLYPLLIAEYFETLDFSENETAIKSHPDQNVHTETNISSLSDHDINRFVNKQTPKIMPKLVISLIAYLVKEIDILVEKNISALQNELQVVPSHRSTEGPL